MTAFVDVAFGDQRYLEQQERLHVSILNIYPDATIFSWTNEMPPGAKSFNDSMYGFKPHAILHAVKRGFKQVMFFDPAVILMDKIDYYQEIVKDYGVIAAQDDNLLTKFCMDRALDYAGFSRNDIEEQKFHLVGGSFYYFDFNLVLCNSIFTHWLTAERLGLFGSQREQASGKLDHGHRNDEAMMALALYANGSKPLTGDVRYNCEGGITKKYHFK